MQTRKQCGTRTGTGRDSDTLVRVEPVPAPPPDSHRGRKGADGRACRATPQAAGTLAAAARHLTAGLLLAFAALVALLPEARAQTTVKMVGNGTASTTYSYLGTNSSGDYRELAQRFTTGSNAGGYTLSAAAMWIGTLPTNAADITNFVAAIYTDTSNRPGTLKYGLTNPSGNFATTGQKNFSAPSDSTLDAGTKYWLVLMNDNATDGYNVTAVSTDSAEDSNSLAGWSIADQRFQRSSRSGSWTSWASELQIRVSGYENPALPELSFVQQILSVNEDAGPAIFTVELDPASTTTVTVEYATRNQIGGAEPGEDYTTTSGTLSFAPTETSKTFAIPILNDDIYEENESFLVDLTNPIGATVPVKTGSVTIDSEDAAPTASLEDVTVDEGAGTMTLTLRLSHPSESDTEYLTNSANVAGTATEGDDYDSFLIQGIAVITVPGGDLSQTFDITIVDDSANEPDETIAIWWHRNSTYEVTPATFSFTGTITDNDTPLPELSFPSSTVSVDEEDGPAQITVTLTPASTGTVTVDYATRDSTTGRAREGDDYIATSGTLTFAPGETSKTITVEILSDDIYEGLESFLVGISNPSGATIPPAPYQTAGVRIVSDEAVPRASMASVTVDEGAGAMTLTLRLNHPSEEDITYFTFDEHFTEVAGTATEGEDYDDFLLETGRRASITVLKGSVSQTFNISIVDDNLEEPDETIELLWRKKNSHTAKPQDLFFTGTIEDNDEGAGAAMGKPRITGDAEVGETLTVSTSGLTDQHGNTKAENGDAGFAYTYQWYRVDAGAETPITGASGRGSTYTLAQADAGKKFRVEVRFTDDAGNNEGPLTSNEYPPDAENGELRLEGGPTALEGRLEVFHDGEWGTVCDDRQDNRNNIAPALACRFVGYANGVLVARDDIVNMSVAPTTQPIWLDDVRCYLGSNHWTGELPSKLHHCYHAGWGNHNCEHEEDVHLRCVEGLGMQTEATPLTASFEDMPQSHDGSGAFTFRIAFSADVDIGRLDMRDHALTVTGGTVKRAKRVDGRSDLWEFRVEPSGTDPVSILVPQDRACTEPGALCTADGQMLTTAPGHSVPGPAPVLPQGQQALEPLAASFVSVPAEHDGETGFWIELSFDAALEQGSKPQFKALLGVTGGSVTRLRRKDDRLDHWQVRVEPSSHGAITVTLAASPPCGTDGAVCTDDGRTFTTALATQIQGPPSLTVADAEVQEAANATLAFAVTLSRAPSGTVTADYATSDGTATAGSDYTATSGTLSFAAGETEKTVSVPVLDDGHDEGSETLTLTLSNPSGAYLEDGTATGTINNTDHMPQAWMARFGRTVADQVLDAVTERMQAPRAPGAALSLAGRQIGGAADVTADVAAAARLDAVTDWLRNPDRATPERDGTAQALTGRDVLTGSTFALTGGSAARGFATVWGRGAVARFDGREGDLALDGEVATGMLGADWTLGDGAAGVVLAHARGDGGYRSPEGDGALEATLSGFYPWGRYAVRDGLSLWGVVGYGTGTLTLTPAGMARIETDLDLRMAALGGRGVLVAAPAAGGFELAATSDAMGVRTTSAEVRGSGGRSLAAAEADVTRLRLGLEGTWRGLKVGTGTLDPSLEIGVRHDGGDAETGFGADLGAGLVWSAPARGIAAELRARGLLTHAAAGFRERGFAGTLTWDPDPVSELGWRLALRQSVGSSPTGGMAALFEANPVQLLDDTPAGGSQLDATLGYGVALPGGYVGMPEVGFALSGTGRELRTAWRVNLAGRGGLSVAFSLEAARRTGDATGRDVEDRIGAGLNVRW